MSITYAIGDIHGRLDLLEAAVSRLSSMPRGRVVFLGDYIDRGPDSRGVVERLIAGPPPGWEWVCLQGNHERAMAIALQGREMPRIRYWLEEGGGQTLLSYGHPAQGRLDLSLIPQAHIEWAAALPLYLEDRHRLFVHAGVDPSVQLLQQHYRVLQRKVYEEGDRGGYRGLHLVHGHRAGLLVEYGQRTNLDTSAWKNDLLRIAKFDDAVAGGPVDVIECYAVRTK